MICAPTRELALQIYSEAKKLAKVYNLTVVCAYGGGSLWEQQKACEAGCEILVCTPVSYYIYVYGICDGVVVTYGFSSSLFIFFQSICCKCSIG